MPYIDQLLNLPMPLLILGVFVSLTIASEAGFWLARIIVRLIYKCTGATYGLDDNVATITNSSLALLALFLGFTFSSALDHFERNRDAVINEAIAINAAYEMAVLQPEPFRTEMVDGLRRYLDIRLQVADTANEESAIRGLQQASQTQQKVLWAAVQKELSEKPDLPMIEPLVASISALVQAETTRTEYLLNGVPNGLFLPVAIFLLFNGVLLGISLGEGHKRHILLSSGLYLLVALAVGIIVDLDRPLKGFINVDQQAMQVIEHRF